ncbi:hypothetical protein [Mariniluteicoccus flavus]
MAKHHLRPGAVTALVVAALALLLGGRADAPLVMAPLRTAPTSPPRTPGSAPATEGDRLAETATLRRTTVGGKVMHYCANGSIDTPLANVERVVFMIHGNDRQACAAARTVLAAGSRDQVRRTLVVAPRFPTLEDRVDARSDLHWSFYGWSQGDASLNDDAPQSSYAVLDELRQRVDAPVEVVAGFSGGGQYVNRYAAGSPIEATRYVVANPSSYLYFSPVRPGGDPRVISGCPAYDSYRYGLNGLNPYMAQSGADELRRRYARRELVYLLGDADSDPRSASMDKECGAMAQGPNRFERGRRYWTYLPSVFGARITDRQSMSVVRGVGHDGGGMMGDAAARKALFG